MGGGGKSRPLDVSGLVSVGKGGRGPGRAPGEFGMNRRAFLTSAGATMLATQLDVLDFASSLLASEPKPAARKQPRVSVVVFRRLQGGGCTWPAGTAEDLRKIQALFVKTVTDAAKLHDVELDVQREPVKDVGACLARLEKARPDGLLVLGMHLHQWGLIGQLLAKRGDVPAIVYANITGFAPEYRAISRQPRTLLGATQSVEWLAYAVRLFKTLHRVEHMKLLHCPTPAYAAEYKKVAAGDKLRAIADYYARSAERIVEPKKEQILEAAKHYLVLRQLMAASGCDGVTVSGPLCIGAGGPKANPACVAVSRLLDEGVPAACERDVDAARCQMLTLSLFDRPGFMGNPSPNTVNNTFIVTHCTSALRLEGTARDYRAPFVLRNFHAMGGVCPMVAWPVGKRATLMDFLGPKSIIVGSGRVVANTKDMPQPPCGGCRTCVEFKVDGVADTLDIVAGHHKWCTLGDYTRAIRGYCKLAGIKAVDLTGKPFAV